MTFQELTTQTTIQQMLNKEYEIYNELDPDILDQKWINAVSKKLSLILAPLNEFELLYTESVSTNILQSIISNNFAYLYNKFVNHVMIINKRWTNIDNYADITESDQQASEGYAGYTVTNQDGDFRKVRNTGTTTSHDKLRYLQFFNQDVNEWGLDIMQEIKRKLLVTIY